MGEVCPAPASSEPLPDFSAPSSTVCGDRNRFLFSTNETVKRQDKFESQAKPKFMKRRHIFLELKRKTLQAVNLNSCPEEEN